MKGIVNLCAIDLVRQKFGDEALAKILTAIGLPPGTDIVELEDYPDEVTVKFIEAASRVLGLTPVQVMHAFGDYWVNQFAAKKFRLIYRKYSNSKDFLKGMTSTHVWATSTMEGAMPPKFIYEEPDANTLVMHYISPRRLTSVLEGLIRGVLSYYKEQAEVRQVASSHPEAACAFRITFV